MNEQRIRKLLLGVLSFALALGVLIPGNIAMAADASQISDVYAYKTIVSTGSGGTRSERVPTLSAYGNSLWFSKSSNERHVIKTYNNNGTFKHLRDTVEVTVYQYGQTGGLYCYLDGVKQTAATVPVTSTVLTASPRPFTMENTYKIRRSVVDPDAPYTILTVGTIQLTNSGTSIPYTRYETNVYIYWDFGDRAAAPNVSFQMDANSGDMLLSGVNSTMEYRLKTETANDWKPCTDAPMYFSATTTKDTAYYVRYAATGSEEASQTKEVILPARRAAPTSTYDTTTEMIASVNANMEIKIGDGAYEPIEAGITALNLSDQVDRIPANGTLTVNLRYKATANAQASFDKKVTIHPRGETPASVSFDYASTSLSGYTTAMQYRLDTDTAWKNMSGTSLDLKGSASGERDVKVYVRLKPTTTASASLAVELTIPKLLPGPAGTLNHAKETVTGLANGAYQYSLNGTSWSALNITDGTWNISNQITTAARTLYLRNAATSTTPITAPTTFALPARAGAPTTPIFVYNDARYPERAVLSGLTTEMEYKKSTDTEWTTATGTEAVLDIPAANVTYNVRYRSIGNTFCSATKNITLSRRANAPGSAYNTTTELLTSINANMEMKYGTGSYTSIETGVTTLSMTDRVDALSSGSTLVVSVRTKATATAPASLDKVITIYPRGAKPTSVVFNYAPTTLTGYTTAMEYRLDTDTAWKNMSGTSLNLQTSASAERDVKVYVRLKATTTASASLPAELTIPKLLPGPTGTVDYLNETITGLTNGAYQYSLNGSSWTALTVSNGKWDISGQITTAARTLYLRNAATTTTPISANTTFAIPARRAGPSTPVFVYNDPSHPERAVMSGVTTDMQYKLSTDTTWTDVAGTTIVLDIPTANATYNVRYRSVGETFGSTNKNLTLSRRANAPGSAYNTTTELLTSINANMEIKYGNEAYTSIETGVTTLSMSDRVNALPSGSTLVVSVRTKATATAPASLDKVITIYPRGAKPTSVVFNYAPTTLTGYTTAMEYRLDTDTAWKNMSGTSLNLQTSASTERDVKVYVRLKATTTASASLPVEFTIPKLLPGSVGTVDYASESVVGLTNGAYQYSLNGTSWTNVTVADGKWDFSSLITTSARTLYLRNAATATTPISAYATYAIPRRPVAPNTPSFVYNDANYPEKVVMSGVTSDMEYRTATETVWTPVGSGTVVMDVPAANVSYYVRYRATGETFASANRTITIAKRAAAPTCKYNAATETITSVNNAMEISFNGGAYTQITATTYDLSSHINDIPANGTLEVKVRRMATASAPASLDAVFTLNARAAFILDIEELPDISDVLSDYDVDDDTEPSDDSILNDSNSQDVDRDILDHEDQDETDTQHGDIQDHSEDGDQGDDEEYQGDQDIVDIANDQDQDAKDDEA